MMCDVVSRVDPDFKVHGHVKVEVRNIDGSLAQCEEHDNYVSPFVYGALRKVTNSRFMQLAHVSSTSTTVTTDLARFSSIYMSKGLNTGLTLTDYAGVANERERVIHGNALAYGGYGASSSENNKGSFNPAESYQKANSQRFVYDFATTQANGSFQSVYTTMQSVNFDYIYNSPLLCTSNKRFIPGVVNDGKTLVYGQNNGVTIMTVDEFINWFQGGTPVSTDHPLREFSNNSRIALRHGELWWSCVKSYVYHAPLSDLTNPTKVTTGNTVSSICWHPKRDTFFTIENVSNTRNLVEYSTTFAQLRTFAIPGAPGSSTDLTALPEEDSIIIGARVFDIDDNANVLQSRQNWFASYGTSTSSFQGCFMGDFLLDNYYLGLDLGTQYFSRARLDNPVTKNSRQTMKITYDFTMPPIEWDA